MIKLAMGRFTLKVQCYHCTIHKALYQLLDNGPVNFRGLKYNSGAILCNLAFGKRGILK